MKSAAARRRFSLATLNSAAAEPGAVQFRSLSPSVGAEVVGLDLRDPIPDAVKQQLVDAWRERALLLFKHQSLTNERLAEAARIFGEIDTTSRNDNDGMYYISNVAKDGQNPHGELGFHKDHLHYPRPMRGIMLFAIETPPPGAGGDTLFSDSRLAHMPLPGALRDRISTLTIRHGERVPNVPGKQAMLVDSPNAQQADHPLVFRHPVTGDDVLFLSGRHVDRVLGLDASDSSALIDELSSYIGRPEISYRHVWEPGDLVLWDNLALHHARTDFDPSYRRHLSRAQIA